MKILLLGYYGYANFGDEWSLAAVAHSIRAVLPQAELTAISSNPQATEALHGLATVSRAPAALRRAITQADVLVCGGGSLLQDVTSTRSLFYYLSIIGYAALNGKKIMLWGQGVGPFQHKQVHLLVQQALNQSSLITLRDRTSLNLLRKLGVVRPVMLLAADPAFGEHFFQHQAAATARPTLTLVLRDWPGKGQQWLSWIAQAVAEFCRERYWKVAICSFQPKHDRAVAVAMLQALEALGVATSVVPDWELLADVAAVFSRSSLILAGRYHAMALATVLGIPTVGVGYDPKVVSLADQLLVPVLSWQDLSDKARTKAVLEAGIIADPHRLQLLVEQAKVSQEAFAKVILAQSKGE